MFTRNLLALAIISALLMGCGPDSSSDDTSSNDTTLEDTAVSSDTENSDAKEDSVSDPCEGIDCGTGGECNAGKCECNSGYEMDADGSCTDIDECMTDNGDCGENAQCSNQEGAAVLCTCKPGFLYNPEGECVPTPACQFVSCGANSHCEEGVCICDAGYEADADGTCADIDECATSNGGCGDALYWSCTNNEGTVATCADIDECASNNGGCGDALYWGCTNNEGTFATCPDIDECASNNGGCGDALYWDCTNNEGTFATCADIDECASNNGGCGDALYWGCTNNEGTVATCADIDECASNNGNCGPPEHVICTDQTGSDPLCSDVDECALGVHNCDVNAICTNTPYTEDEAGWACTCIPGYTGDGTTCACDVDSLVIECLWSQLYALDGLHWVYRAQDAYLDLEHTQPIANGDAALSFKASGNNIPTVSDLDWTAGLDYTEQQLWYKGFGPRPAYFDHGNGDEYVYFVNGMATNFESQPGQLSPREAKGDFHLIHCFRSMPGAHYEAGGFGGGISWKDRSGSNQIKIVVGANAWVYGPADKVTVWGQDNIVEIKLSANGDTQLFLNQELLIDTNFPGLNAEGVLYEFNLGTNSHIMAHHFRAVMMKRNGHFTADELAVIYETTDALWPRGQFPSFPYLDGAWTNSATTWNYLSKIWSPATGSFSGGNGEEGTHLHQWYYWRKDDPLFGEDNPLRAHLPIPGATGPSLTRTEYVTDNTLGNPVIFDKPGDGTVQVMRVITPVDSAGTQGEPLAGSWVYDNIDDNECTLGTDNCSDDATCLNVPGSFECSCNPGYDGDGVSCTDIDECDTNNGECGDATYTNCTNNVGAVPTCTDIDECATNNGGCGDALYWGCTNNEGTFATCADIDECATNNGGCGDALDWDCTNNAGAVATCTLANGLACNAGGTPCTSGNCYEDFDGDGYDPGNASPSSKCHPAPPFVGVDCDDNCATCFPGSSATTTETDLLDQNCDGNLNDYTGVLPKVCDLSATGQTAANGLPIPQNQMCQANSNIPGMLNGCDSYCEAGGTFSSAVAALASGTVTHPNVWVSGSGYPGFNWATCYFIPLPGWGLNSHGRTGCQTVKTGYPIRTCTCNGAYAFSGYH